MIRKLDNGTTLITLGKGTVNVGIIKPKDSDVANGIGFTTGNEIDAESVVIEINDYKGVASYLLGITKVLATWTDDHEFLANVHSLQKDLIKHMDFEKGDN